MVHEKQGTEIHETNDASQKCVNCQKQHAACRVDSHLQATDYNESMKSCSLSETAGVESMKRSLQKETYLFMSKPLL